MVPFPLFSFIRTVFFGIVSHSSWFRRLLVLLLSEGHSLSKPCFSFCRLAEDSGEANTQNCRLCKAIGKWWFYGILGISHPWSKTLCSAPGTFSCVFSFPPLEKDGDPLQEASSHKKVIIARKGVVPFSWWGNVDIMIIILNLDSLQNSHIKEMKLCIGT